MRRDRRAALASGLKGSSIFTGASVHHYVRTAAAVRAALLTSSAVANGWK
jgi:hypothetical protein